MWKSKSENKKDVYITHKVQLSNKHNRFYVKVWQISEEWEEEDHLEFW
jgi:hypothetical protein